MIPHPKLDPFKLFHIIIHSHCPLGSNKDTSLGSQATRTEEDVRIRILKRIFLTLIVKIGTKIFNLWFLGFYTDHIGIGPETFLVLELIRIG